MPNFLIALFLVAHGIVHLILAYDTENDVRTMQILPPLRKNVA